MIIGLFACFSEETFMEVTKLEIAVVGDKDHFLNSQTIISIF
jgi:hypothetical protein